MMTATTGRRMIRERLRRSFEAIPRCSRS